MHMIRNGCYAAMHHIMNLFFTNNVCAVLFTGLFPVVFSIIDSENTLSHIVDDGCTLTFVSGRNGGLLQSMLIIFLSAHHTFCLLHLQMNLRDQMKYVNATHKIGLMSKLRECIYAPTVTCFNRKLEICIISIGLTRISSICSMRVQIPTNGQRHDEMWSNVVESFNNWIREVRYLPITQLVDTIMGKIIEKGTKHRVQSST
ncbi:hypothetical protein ACSBR2_009537 [Camellia fascicularis]